MVRTTASPAAHDLYLKGRHLSARRSPESMAQALACFERAVEADPSYAAAHAAIGECHAVAGFAGFARPSDVFPLARQAAMRARGTRPRHWPMRTPCSATCGNVRLAVGGGRGALPAGARAESRLRARARLVLAPAHGLGSVRRSGRGNRARVRVRPALAHRANHARPGALLRAPVRAGGRDVQERCSTADPSFALAHFHLGRLCMVQGRLEEAVEQHAAASAIPTALGFLAGAWRRLGRPDRAATWCAKSTGWRPRGTSARSPGSRPTPTTPTTSSSGSSGRSMRGRARCAAEHRCRGRSPPW